MNKYLSSYYLPLFIVATATFIIHLFAITQYDYFRDEFYYIACSNHLDFGFVDHPPLADAILLLIRNILGESLIAIRIVPIILSCTLIFFAGLLAEEFGGGKFAILVAGIGAATAPVLRGTAADYSMNVFDQLFWFSSMYFLVRYIKTKSTKYLIFMGLSFGFGLETKHLIAFLLVGTGVGIVFTDHRSILRNKWLWISLLTAFLLFLPNLIWQYGHNFPNLEFARNATLYKNTNTTFVGFISGHFLEANPPQIILILSAMWFFFRSPEGKRYRVIGIAYLVVLAGYISTNGKTYYIAPMLPILFAAGATQLERSLDRTKWNLLKPVLIITPIVTWMLILPMAIPILPVDSFINYKNAIGIRGPENERHEMGPLPQHYADMFGWRELVLNVAKVYTSLPDSLKNDCAIYTTNYGRAGAIDFFGERYGLPKSICGHNNYWLWGPGNATGSTVIIVGGTMKDHKDDFENVVEAGTTDNPYAMPYERNLSIFVGRHLKIPMKKAWIETRHYN